jgi:hypothetical protein
MFRKLLPQLLRAADVACLASFIAAAQQDDDLPSMKSVIHTESRAKGDSQLKHSAAHGFAIAKISGAHAGQAGIHRHLHSLVAKGIEPLVKRDESVLKLQLPDLPFEHRKVVIYR